MNPFSNRRTLLLALTSLPFSGCSFHPGGSRHHKLALRRLAELEVAAKGRLGIAALNTADGALIEHRGGERFPFCSTFKVVLCGAILKRSETERGLLAKQIAYGQGDLVTYSPITEKHVGDGLTVAELCAAALQYSDNTAANLLIGELGGTKAVTAFARSIGDAKFRLDRLETALNTGIPGDPRDTTTPLAMMRDLQSLTLGDALGKSEREQLVTWMRGNTTGAKRIRAGVPASWAVADKTGSGDYGTGNDVGLLYPLGKPPILLAVYFTQPNKDATWNNEVVAKAAGVVVEAFEAM